MKRAFMLPAEIAEGANLSGNEYGWSPAAFPHALKKACTLGYACLGGQFQFRAPKATYEMYWLNADPDERGAEESWEEFQLRSCVQTLERYERRLAETDFVAEGHRLRTLLELSAPEDEPLDYLCFVAYFRSRQQYEMRHNRKMG
jgi:hypothetical protein